MASTTELLALGLQHHQAGDLAQAEQHYLRVLQVEPQQPDALHLFGVLAHQVGRNDVALQYVRDAIAVQPLQPAFHFHLGLIHQALGDAAQAEAAYREALRLAPEYPEALNNLGLLLMQRGDQAGAEAALRKAVRLRPQYADPRFNLGWLLLQQQKLEDAEILLRKATELNPGFAPGLFRLGVVLAGRGRPVEAETAYREALRLAPTMFEAHANLGIVLLAQGRLTEAEAAYRQALALSPGTTEILMNLGNVLQEQGRIGEAKAYLQETLRRLPAFDPASTSWLLTLNYDPASTPELLLQEHQKRSAQLLPAEPLNPVYDNERTPDRTLRVGYVSPDFRRHPVAAFIEPILAQHDRSRVVSYAYAEVVVGDETTQRLRGLAHHWRSTCGLGDDEVAAQVRSDRIDLLVDLAGHTSGNRLRVFARKPAPIQATYLGYVNTTGLATIDYRLTDAVADPPGEAATHTEELWRLPGCFCCYAPPASAPDIGPLPAQRAGGITFGSMHHLAKLNDQVIDVWSALLQSLPTSRLLIFRHTLQGDLPERLHQAFERRGVPRQRVELRSALPPGGHLAVYHDIDVALDVFPWCGHTTSCEALWMGVPVVTLRGNRHAGRMVASVLECLDLKDWIAGSPQEYIARAAAAALDWPGLMTLRMALRERMRTSPLCDAVGFTRKLEAAYAEMWARWCLS